MQIDIYLKFIGNFQVPQDEPTAEEMAEEEKQKQRRAKKSGKSRPLHGEKEIERRTGEGGCSP